MKGKFLSFFVVTILLSVIHFNQVLAHPGNTDSLGCHTCRTNCSSWGLSYGEYHCHNNKGVAQPSYPIHSTYGYGGTGYTSPAPDYAYPSITTTPSCPLMSYYDSVSKSCKCYSGYVVDTNFAGDEVCVSADSKCSDLLGYGGRYNSLTEKCECKYGYVFNGDECESESSYCTGLMGFMSQYNTLTDRCECMAGYEFDGSSCKYKKANYSYNSGYYTNINDCPINSHTKIGSTGCFCDDGYEVNAGKDACVLSLINYDRDCQNSFGINSLWDGTKTATGLLNCVCKSGYNWNSNRTSCDLVGVSANDQICKNAYGMNSVWSGTNDINGLLVCGCQSGYGWNSTKTMCVD